MSFLLVPIIGLFGLSFRIWLCEYKVKNELEYRRYYISRIISYIMYIGFIFSNSLMIFNIILVCVWPGFIGAFLIRDLKFLSKIDVFEIPQDKKNWLVIERLTMHIPNIVFGILPYLAGDLKFFILGGISNDNYYLQALHMLLSVFLLSGVFFFLDYRWIKKISWPIGKYLWNIMFFTGLFMYSFIYYI
ncbi:MAG: hypothetical protein GY870_21095 [archaeon]|nr:hypothetical protein [archaeon]